MIVPQIIHDPRKNERLAPLMDELHIQNISNAVIWEATIDLPTVEASINKSHKDIIRWAKERDLDEVCIFEDDLMFQDQYSWQTFLNHRPDKERVRCDLYMGGAYGIGGFNESRDLNNGAAASLTSFQGLHCYICYKEFYDTFLSVPDDQHIDVALAGLGNYWVCQPMVAFQRPGYSSTAKKIVNYNQ